MSHPDGYTTVQQKISITITRIRADSYSRGERVVNTGFVDGEWPLVYICVV
jgi:hypothetical protein